MRRRIGQFILALSLCVMSAAFAGAAGHDDGSGAVVVFLLLVWLSAAPLVTLLAAVAPQLPQRATQILEARRRPAFWLGLLVFGVSVVLLGGFQSLMAQGAGVFGLVAFLFGTVFMLAWMVGYSGVAHYLGRRMLPDPAVSCALATLVGGGVLTLASLFPLIGQVIGFYVTCVSLGLFPYTWFGAQLPFDAKAVDPGG